MNKGNSYLALLRYKHEPFILCMLPWKHQNYMAILSVGRL